MPTISRIGGERTVLLTQAEAAAQIGVSVRTLRSYIRRGLIPAVYIRRCCYIWDRHLLQFIRGAKSTRTVEAVRAPKYESVAFDAPPDPFYSFEDETALKAL